MAAAHSMASCVCGEQRRVSLPVAKDCVCLVVPSVGFEDPAFLFLRILRSPK